MLTETSPPTWAAYRQPRIAFLNAAQNADGGWGYRAGKQSWIEPTAYALLALGPGRSAAFVRGWQWMRSLQLPSGAWPASAEAFRAHSVTSLVITLHRVAGVFDAAYARGVEWLLTTEGSEGTGLMRVAHFLRPSVVEFDPRLTGWPWQPGTASWVEPTAHALMALKGAAAHIQDPRLGARIALGERMLLDRRCRDSGWNYGNRRVLGMDLPSYPEVTALALMALVRSPAIDWDAARASLERYRVETPSPLARAWIVLCLKTLGVPVCPSLEEAPKGESRDTDILVTALEALAGGGVQA